MTAAQQYKVEVKIDAKTGGLVGEAKAANDEIGKLNSKVSDSQQHFKRSGNEAVKAGNKIKSYGSNNSVASKAVNKLDGAMRSMIGTFAAYLALSTAGDLIDQADAFDLLTSRVERLSESTIAAEQNMAFLIATSSDTGTDLASTVQLWESLTSSLGELGYQQDDIQQLTSSLQQLGVIGGSSAEDMSNALRQLGQGFAGGIIRAEEWNSVVEQMPEIWRRVASASGLRLGQLRQQMLDGKLTADFVMEALESQVESINEDFDNMPVTAERAALGVQNSFSRFLSTLDAELGASTFYTQFLQGLSTSLDEFERNSRSRSISLELDTTSQADLDAQLIKIDNQLKQLEFQKAKLAQLPNFSADNTILQEVESQIAELERLRSDKFKTIQQVIIAPETIPGNKTAGDKPEEPETVDPNAEIEAKKFADAKSNAERFAEQIRRRNLDELALIQARYQDEIDIINEYEQAKYLNAQQAATARSQLETDRDTQVEEYEKKLAAEREQQEKELALFQEGMASKADLVNIEYQNRLEQLNEFREAELIGAKEHADLLAQIEQDRADQITAIKLAELDVQMNASRSTADNLAAIAGGLAGKQSKAYMAMFAVSKAMAIAQASIAMAQNIAEASKVGFPYNIPLIAGATAQGATILAQVQSVQLAGQAHDGISRVPNEGTWNLAKGERVYTNESADQLDRMYERIMNGGGAAGVSFQIVNIIDPSLFSQYLDSASGQKSILNTIDANSTEIANMLA